MRSKVFNSSIDKNKRKLLRNNMPRAETIIWSKLRNKQTGCKFRRQYSVDKFVLDFYCPELKLAIEIDGDNHFVEKEKMNYDNNRQKIIESLEINFLRFQNIEIFKNLNGIMSVIYEKIKELGTSPNPSSQRRGTASSNPVRRQSLWQRTAPPKCLSLPL
ncbi:MAG: endonuclease domain-containing protein [bacterium]